MSLLKTSQLPNSSISTPSSSHSCVTASHKHSTNSTPPSSVCSSSSTGIYNKSSSSNRLQQSNQQLIIHENTLSSTSPHSKRVSSTSNNASDRELRAKSTNNQFISTTSSNEVPSNLILCSSTLSKNSDSKSPNANHYHHHRLPDYALSVTKPDPQQHKSQQQNQPIYAHRLSNSSIVSSSSSPDSQTNEGDSKLPLLVDQSKSKLLFTKQAIPSHVGSSVRRHSTPLSRLSLTGSAISSFMPNVSCPVHGPLAIPSVRRDSLPCLELPPINTVSLESRSTITDTSNQTNRESSLSSAASVLSVGAQTVAPDTSCDDCMSIVREVKAQAKSAITIQPKSNKSRSDNKNINTTFNRDQVVKKASNNTKTQSQQPIAEIKGRATLPRLNKTTNNSALQDLFVPKNMDIPMSVEIGAHSAFVSTDRLADTSTHRQPYRLYQTLTLASGAAQLHPNPTPNHDASRSAASNTASVNFDSSVDIESVKNPTSLNVSTSCSDSVGAVEALNTETFPSIDTNFTNTNNTDTTRAGNNTTLSLQQPSKPAAERVLPLLCVKTPPRPNLKLTNNKAASNLSVASALFSSKSVKNPRFSAISSNNHKAISLPSSPTSGLMPVNSVSSAASVRPTTTSNKNINNNVTDSSTLGSCKNASSSSLSTIQAVPPLPHNNSQIGNSSTVSNGTVSGATPNAHLGDSYTKDIQVGIRPTKKPMYTPSVLRRTMTADRLNTIGSALGNKNVNDEETAEYYNYYNAISSRKSPFKKSTMSSVSLRALSSKFSPTHSPKSSLSSLEANVFSSSSLSSMNPSTISRSSSFLDEPTKTHWKADSSRNTCKSCEVPFSLFNRRHHCRQCGDLFCDKCSSYVVRLDPQCKFHILGQKARACSVCFEIYKQFVEKVDDATDINTLALFSSGLSPLMHNSKSESMYYSGTTTPPSTTGSSGYSTPSNKSRGSALATHHQSNAGASFCISPVDSEHSSRNESISITGGIDNSATASPLHQTTINNHHIIQPELPGTIKSSATMPVSNVGLQNVNDDVNSNTMDSHNNSHSANPQLLPAGSLPPNWNWSTF